MNLKFYPVPVFVLLVLLVACGAPATVTGAPSPITMVVQPTQVLAPSVVAPAQMQNDPTPKVRTVWNTVIGSNKAEGTCAGNPILPAYGQVQLTPSNDTLEYKNQQATYLFKRVAAGAWYFAGPSPLNDGSSVDLSLTFKDDKNLEVIHKLIPTRDVGCMHTFTYSGTFMWERP